MPVKLKDATLVVNGTGLNNVKQILFGSTALSFNSTPPGDGKQLTITGLDVKDTSGPTETSGTRSLLFIFADQYTQAFAFDIAAPAKAPAAAPPKTPVPAAKTPTAPGKASGKP
jgi:hypothetical protein